MQSDIEAYGVQIWCCTKESNYRSTRTFQNEILRGVVNALWHATANDIHWNLGIPSVKEEIRNITGNHKVRVYEHAIIEAIQIVGNRTNGRVLKRIELDKLTSSK